MLPKRHTLTGNNHRNSDDETPSKVIPSGRVLAELAVSTKSPLPEGEDSHNRKLKRALGAPTPAGLRKAEGPFAVRPGSRFPRHSCCKERPVGFLSPKARNSRHFGCELFQGHSPVQYTPCLCKVRKACPDRYRLMWSRTACGWAFAVTSLSSAARRTFGNLCLSWGFHSAQSARLCPRMSL